jgi:hypothetical protein
MSVAVVTSLAAVQQSWRTVFGHWVRYGGLADGIDFEGDYWVWQSLATIVVSFLWVILIACCGLEDDGSTLQMRIGNAGRRRSRQNHVTGGDC